MNRYFPNEVARSARLANFQFFYVSGGISRRKERKSTILTRELRFRKTINFISTEISCAGFLNFSEIAIVFIFFAKSYIVL